MSGSTSQSRSHCINPYCRYPYPQDWTQKQCQSCGTLLLLQQRYIPLQRLRQGEQIHIYLLYDQTNGSQRIMRILAVPTRQALETFEREALILLNPFHRGLPKVEIGAYFHAEINHSKLRMVPCLVMEKLEGPTLQDVVEKCPKGCPEVWVLDWLRQAVDILQKLHNRNIFHGCLHPGSFVLRRGTRQLAIADLGFPPPSQSASTLSWIDGYRLPESSRSGVIGPATDFYAVGRVCIHLLTGCHPRSLEEAMTGTLQWRKRTRVNQPLADLLDRLVQREDHYRLSNAAEIMDLINRVPIKPGSPRPDLQTLLTAPSRGSTRHPVLPGQQGRITDPNHLLSVAKVQGLLKPPSPVPSPTPLALMSANSSRYKIKIQVGMVAKRKLLPFSRTWSEAIAHLDNIRSWLLHTMLQVGRLMVLGGLGGTLAASLGFWLTYWSPLAPLFKGAFTHPVIIPQITLALMPAILVFATAGFGTTWTLTWVRFAESASQRWSQRWTGGWSYALAWLTWQWSTPSSVAPAIARLTAIMALGLMLAAGSPHYRFVQALVVAIGTATTFSALVNVHLWQPHLLLNLLQTNYLVIPNWTMFETTITFFGLVGLVSGFWLGCLDQIGIPCLKYLNKRL
jgi:serine/threonine protein kinase